jgi:hypothetical protein
MSLRRAVAWAVVALALLVHLVAGIAGPGMQLCVCATGVAIAPQHTACCGSEAEADDPVGTADGCTDCHLIPLPDDAAVALSPVPGPPPRAVLPDPVQITVIVWPMRPQPSLGRPPDPVPRRVRTVVLTC